MPFLKSLFHLFQRFYNKLLAPFFGSQTLSLMLFSLLTYVIFLILIFISKVYKIDFNFI